MTPTCAWSGFATILRRYDKSINCARTYNQLKVKNSHSESEKVWKVPLSRQLLVLHKPNSRHLYISSVWTSMKFAVGVSYCTFLKVSIQTDSKNFIHSKTDIYIYIYICISFYGKFRSYQDLVNWFLIYFPSKKCDYKFEIWYTY